MYIIPPVNITDAVLAASSVPETDHPEWAAGTSYGLGQRVIRATTHRIYECLVAGVNAGLPEAAPARWLDVAPTNRWAAFDKSVGSYTTAAGSLTITLAPGTRIGALALLDVQAAGVSVRMTVNGNEVYSRTAVLTRTVEPIVDYFTYWQAEFTSKTSVAFGDLPSVYSSGVITVTLTGGAIRLGTLVLGKNFYIGETEFGLRVNTTDYSLTETKFGITSYVQGPYSRRIECTVIVSNDRIDSIFATLDALRATPVVCVAATPYDVAVVFGLIKGRELAVKYAKESAIAFLQEGLT